jgi:MFS family permease
VIVVGGVWPRLGRSGERFVLVAAALLAAAGGGLALAIERAAALHHPLFFAAVFFIVAMATQGVVATRSLYIVAHTEEGNRPRFLAVGNMLTGVASVALAGIFGTIAHIHDAIWSIFLIVGLNVVAALWCLRLAEPAANAPPAAA